VKKPLRILVFDPSGELLGRVLHHLVDIAGAHAPGHAESHAALERALRQQAWDAILACDAAAGQALLEAWALVQTFGQDASFLAIVEGNEAPPLLTAVRAGIQQFVTLKELEHLPRHLEAAVANRPPLAPPPETGSNASYRRLVEKTALGWLRTDLDGRVLQANRAYATFAGEEDPASLLGRNMLEWTVPEYTGAVREALAVCARHGAVGELEVSCRQPSGNRVHLLMSGVLEYEARGPSAVFLCRNISVRKNAESLLRASTRQFQVLFDWSPDAILIVNTVDGTLLKVNERVRRVLHYVPDRLLGTPLSQLFPRDALFDLERWRSTLDAGEGLFETRMVLNANGQPVPMDIAATLIPWEEDVAILVTLRNVHEKQEAERQRARFAAIVEQAWESIVITDTSGKIEYVNPSFEQVTGFRREEVIGMNPRVLKSGQQDAAFYKELWDTISSGRVWQGLLSNRKKSGEIFWEKATITPIRDGGGSVAGYVAVKQDVSKEHELEARLRQAQKMEAIGTLAGGIAHDFNNILSAIIGYSELALGEIPRDQEAHDYVRQALSGGQRAAELVRQILAFSRQSEQERLVVQLHHLLREALKLLRGSLPSTIIIESEIETDVGPVLVDTTQIHQVVMNLCTNAFHAMRHTGGVLRVNYARVDVDTAMAEAQSDLAKGPYARIQIIDTGCGIADEIRDRIFEPYFTTKKKGEGTGLGLATAHGIVHNHGGAIRLHSKPGQGSTFEVYLPIAAVPQSAVASEHEGSPVANREAKRVLLVDDEEMLAELGKQGLERYGFDVEVYCDSREAMSAFARNPAHYDLVVTDQTMPYLTGVHLAKGIMDIRPEIPIVLLTGFSEDIDEVGAQSMGLYAFMRKPFIVGDLVTVLRRAAEGLPPTAPN
jgi:PAS domain S-box-containing protein